MSKRRPRKNDQEFILEITPKNRSQEEALEKIENNIITFLLGPAGTGKTYLAIGHSISELLKRKYNKIILTRPAIEACGERLGHLPGTFEDKLNPYMIPLLEFLFKLQGVDNTQAYLTNGQIELAPLSFMRGRTFDRSIVILDEAQNTTKEQIKMILTRIGDRSKIILCGDTEQSDIKNCRLKEIAEKLISVESIDLHEFYDQDIVRNPLIGKIMNVFRDMDKKT